VTRTSLRPAYGLSGLRTARTRDLRALADEVGRIGREAGLDAVGIAEARPFDRARRVLDERKAAGLHGGMQFTYRNPARATDPARSLPGARALVVGARAYRRRRPPPPAEGGPWGSVAAYSWRDHYAPLRAALQEVADRLARDGWGTRVLVDDNALVDREAAYRAGIGWFGKNANLLLPGLGSWFVLGSVVTDAPLPPDADVPLDDGCGSCTKCLTACPTGALVAPGVLDARRCLAWLLEAPGSFPVEHREALGGRVYGCDDCQEVCPPNRAADRRTPPPLAEADAEPWVSLVELLDLDDEALLARFARWYVPRREARYLRRNALVALGNVGDGADPEVERVLRSALADPDALVVEHARWAAARLGRHDLVP
jgi:epoxyqueuosine reductase